MGMVKPVVLPIPIKVPLIKDNRSVRVVASPREIDLQWSGPLIRVYGDCCRRSGFGNFNGDFNGVSHIPFINNLHNRDICSCIFVFMDCSPSGCKLYLKDTVPIEIPEKLLDTTIYRVNGIEGKSHR